MADKTPQVNFTFTNNNVQASVPQLGISHVLARTTRGPFNKPDTVFATYAAFKRVYGEEIVPDGTVGNIRKAFELGSQLRVSRVAGADEVVFGTSKVFTPGGSVGTASGIMFTFYDPDDPTTHRFEVKANITTQEAGSAIVDLTDYGADKNFYLAVTSGDGPTLKAYLTQAKALGSDGSITASDIIDSRLMFSASKKPATIDGTSGKAFIDTQVFQEFLSNVPNLEFSGITATEWEGSTSTPLPSVTDTPTLISFIRTHNNWWVKISSSTVTATDIQNAPIYLQINEGNNGGDSDNDSWLDAYEAIRGYQDGYQLFLSHIHQHIPEDYQGVYLTIGQDVNSNYEIVLYVELPKYNADGTVPTTEEYLTAIEALVPATGVGKCIAYFGGGAKYYDDFGALQNCDVLGSVVGLGDTCASNYGPWKSFAGQNRGVIAGAMGPVIKNLGSSADVPSLNAFAQWYLNLFVVKDTRNMGRQMMLQSLFTANPRNDSEKFLSIVRLNLYLKKNLRPILESYLEEPNTFETWKNLYLEVKPFLDNLVDELAISPGYQWLGDQDATSYEQLIVNNEADVRQGKYRVVLKYKDIVPIQEISMEIVIDAVNSTIDIQPV